MTHQAIERILRQIEARSLDLTCSYAQWLKLAFALSTLGESGRSYFHRLSRFHPEYDPAECDLQFSRCLASKGTGINLGSFFHLAKEAGIPNQTTVRDIEQGKDVKLSNLQAVARVLGLKIEMVEAS